MNKMIPKNFTCEDRLALQQLGEQLASELGGNLLDLVLFGSRARGDARSDSDIDVLVLLAQSNWPVEHRVLTIASRLSLEHDVIFNPYVVSQERWEWMQRVQHPLHHSILLEGIPLAHLSPAGR
jgi:uncharacterized protein